MPHLKRKFFSITENFSRILENYQTEEGIKIPEVLIPYTGFDMIS